MIQIQITQISNGWIVAVNSINPLNQQPQQRATYCADLAATIVVLKTIWPADEMLKIVKR